MADSHPSPSFTNVFNQCLDEFFNGKENAVLGELMRYVIGQNTMPEPRECGKHKIRIKQLLPETNTIAYYWDYGRVWQFFGIVESENDSHLKRLTQLLIEMNGESLD